MQEQSSDATPSPSRLLRNLTTSVIVEDRVETTVAKAKAVRPHIEKMITLGKKGDLHSRRQALSYLMTDASVERLFDVVPRATPIVRAATCASSAAVSARAMAARRPLSNFSARKFSWMPSAKSVRSSRPRSALNSKSS